MASSAKSPNFFSRLVKGSGPKSPDEAQTAHSRRREQVRRAQRTHRERKEKYVRNLEVEVANLRELDSLHAQEIESYKHKIRHLQDLLTSNGIAVPAHLLLSQTPSPQASIALVDHPDGTQGMYATMPVYGQQAPSPSAVTVPGYQQQHQHQSVPSPSQSPHAMYQPTEQSENTSSVASQVNTFNPNSSSGTNSNPGSQIPNILRPGISHSQPKNTQSQSVHPQGLDASQIAVDFVLALESPCLHHHPDDPNAIGDDPSGHSLMLQSPIMHRSPLPHIRSGKDSKEPQRYPSNMTWNVPAQEIEKLLGLSARLSLEGEITPIEAWQRIRGHPSFALLDMNRLDALKSVLVGEVRCYGFGAVIDEDYFDMILRQAFAQLVP